MVQLYNVVGHTVRVDCHGWGQSMVRYNIPFEGPLYLDPSPVPVTKGVTSRFELI